MKPAVACLSLLVALGCSPADGASDGGASDGGASDGGARDGGASDGGARADAGGDASPPDAGPRDGGRLADAGPAFELPPANAVLDYQLGGPYAPPDGVEIVARDRTAPIATGLYNVCYVNGFQIQPDEEAFWTSEHPDLILRDAAGQPVIDTDWDEMLIDVGSPDKRARVAAIVGGWIRGSAVDGFDAVEIDNLDSFSRSGDRLTEDDAVATMRLFADVAHAEGLAVAQKNSAELVSRRAAMDTDFVVAEECNRYSECDVYAGAYGDSVLVIEYRRADFTAGCAAFPGLSIVLRDLDLVTPSDAAYVYDGC